MYLCKDQELAAIAASLPQAEEALLPVAKESVIAFDQAIVGRDFESANLAYHHYRAVIAKLVAQDDTPSFAHGQAAGYRVEQYCAQKPGRVPMWLQKGEFVIEVNGIRAVAHSAFFLSGSPHFQFYAVDVHRPFISSTGYRSHFVSDIPLGCSVQTAAELILDGLRDSEGLQMIDADVQPKPFDWLKRLPPLSASVEFNGQIVMAL